MFLSTIQLVTALGATVLALYVLDLVRRRRLSEDFSLLWLVSSAVIAILGFSTGLLRGVTHVLGILYETSTVFAFGLGFTVIGLLYLSIRLSRLSQENVLLARELALLRQSCEASGVGVAAAGAPAGARGPEANRS
jgi:hypothetical protein